MPGDVVDDYKRWNQAVADVVYRHEDAGVPVYLDLEEDLLERVAAAADFAPMGARESLISAVRGTLESLTHPDGIFCRHTWRARAWKRHGAIGPPPHLALLAVLSLAAETMRDGDGHSANNYYDRLMPLLGYVSKTARDRMVSSYRACSAELWGALNFWLESLDGERGLPTAFATTHAHVGLPMSQALVRATDRDHILELFSELGLPPRSDLPTGEMEDHLADWIARRGTNTLQSLWRSSVARSRIVECARQLLQAWDGTVAEGPSEKDRPRRLLITAMVRSFAGRSLLLNVVGSDIGDLLTGHALVDIAGTQTPAEVDLTVAAGSRWRLEHPDAIDAKALIEGRLSLRRGSTRFERKPQRLVPLRRDDLLVQYVEAERLPLAEPSLILCVDELADQVRSALDVIARPGYQMSRDLRGCPNGWVLFSDVQVLGDLPLRNPGNNQPWRIELNLLQPIASSQVALQGGLRLPGRLRTYSSLVAPELTVSTSALGAISAEIRAKEDDDVLIAEHGVEHQTMIWPLATLDLPDGDYEVTASQKHEPSPQLLESIRFRLRSADTPASRRVQQEVLVRPLTRPAEAVVTAVPIGEGPFLLGAELVNARSETQGTAAPPAPDHADVLPSWYRLRQQPETSPPALRIRFRIPSAGGADCFTTGAHHIVLPTFDGRTRGSTVVGICRDCGLVKRFPTHLRQKPAKVRHNALPEPPRFTPLDVATVSGDTAIDVNMAFDGLCQTVAGPVTAFDQIALQVEPSHLFADRFLRSLETLGHIEVRRDLGTLVAKEFQVTPPRLVQLPSGWFVAVGHRSRSLVTALETAATAAGTTLDRTPMEAAPDRIRIKGLDLATARLVSESVAETIGHPLVVVPDPCQQIAALLPPLSSVMMDRPRRPMTAARSIERWDVERAQWAATPDAGAPGAYRFIAGTPTYVLRDAQDIDDGTMVRCEARLLKHAAAARACQPIIGYQAETETLYMPLGAELPLLYGRAAALASGKVPMTDGKQRIVFYQSVPAALAAQLMTSLMN